MVVKHMCGFVIWPTNATSGNFTYVHTDASPLVPPYATPPYSVTWILCHTKCMGLNQVGVWASLKSKILWSPLFL